MRFHFLAAGLTAFVLIGASSPSKPSLAPRPTPGAMLAAQLEAAMAKAPVPTPGKCLEIQYEGIVELEAHLRRPGDKQPYHSRQRFLANGRGAVRMDWTTWIEGDSAGAPESWLFTGGGAHPGGPPTAGGAHPGGPPTGGGAPGTGGRLVLYRPEPSAPWRAVGPDRKEQALAQVTAGLPWELARVLRGTATARGVRVTGGGPGGMWDISAEGIPGSGALTLRPVDAAVISYVTTRAHPRLGDVRDGVLYAYGEPGMVPTELRQIVHERDQQWAMTERRVSMRTDSPEDSLLAAPAEFQPAEPADSMRAEARLAPVAAGVWSVDMDDLDTRSLVVEFADKLAVIEAAVGSENGERIADAAKRRFPNKPIGWFLFSHHHPHYAGGLRAFVAEGATVVTTPGNEHFVRQVAERAFTLRPDRLARTRRPLRLQTFAKRFEIADSTNRLVAVDIGSRSDHTNEFTVFWFPRQRLLFETEQGWVTVEGKTRASRRAERFLKTIDEEKLASDRIVQSWPMRGNPASLSRVELDSLVTLRGRALPQTTAGVKP